MGIGEVRYGLCIVGWQCAPLPHHLHILPTLQRSHALLANEGFCVYLIGMTVEGMEGSGEWNAPVSIDR